MDGFNTNEKLIKCIEEINKKFGYKIDINSFKLSDTLQFDSFNGKIFKYRILDNKEYSNVTDIVNHPIIDMIYNNVKSTIDFMENSKLIKKYEKYEILEYFIPNCSSVINKFRQIVINLNTFTIQRQTLLLAYLLYNNKVKCKFDSVFILKLNTKKLDIMPEDIIIKAKLLIISDKMNLPDLYVYFEQTLDKFRKRMHLKINKRRRSCASCLKTKPKTYLCGNCMTIHYCSVQCQKRDWKNHKLFCKNLVLVRQLKKKINH